MASEISGLRARGFQVIVCPLRPLRRLAAGVEARQTAECSLWIPLLGLKTWLRALHFAILHPGNSTKALVALYRGTRGLQKRLKNIAVIPKGLALAWVARRMQVDHIYCHWASTPSSAAFIASSASGIPWSFTAHRWDIKEDNALTAKIQSASFVRAISQKGLGQLQSKAPKEEGKIRCIHMGISVDVMSSLKSPDRLTWGVPVIACPANLIEVKGHSFLVEACRILKEEGVPFVCHMYGQGPLEESLRARAEEMGLNRRVKWFGQIPHKELLDLYADGNIQIVVLPSITTQNGDEEGIPVSLMEAMAAGIPVVSTMTGGIEELLGSGAGVLVPEKDPVALANAVRSLILDSGLREEVAKTGNRRVIEEFSIDRTLMELSNLIQNSARGRHVPGTPDSLASTDKKSRSTTSLSSDFS